MSFHLKILLIEIWKMFFDGSYLSKYYKKDYYLVQIAFFMRGWNKMYKR